ncbi:hypothetical protein KKF34_10140 [Myxococcota bacterium]|nr:hypothetical protein [Myxococcota bacterium]MBU1381221.1 hypothetical protein [Myxococcota bacterium]MBU1497226.1 hypothetical protein [Myxococcota bacterium]
MPNTKIKRFNKNSKTVLAVLSFFTCLLIPSASAIFYPSDVYAEPAECLSMDPSDWPQPAKPYFIFLVDTSGSMTSCTNPYQYMTSCPSTSPLNSCGMIPNRINDAKCALRQAVLAYGGQVNFGLSIFPRIMSGCASGTCASSCPNPNTYCGNETYGCTISNFPSASANCGNRPNCTTGTGIGPSVPNLPENTWYNGANIVVPLVQDPWDGSTASTDNITEILKWFDGSCAESKELFASGATPSAPALRSLSQYLRAGWSIWTTSNYCEPPAFTYPTPLDEDDRACRSVNIIFVTDGDPTTCEGSDQTKAVQIAQDLFQNGVTLGTSNFKVKTFVINFAGGNQTNTDAIASAGGTGASLFANNEVELAQAFSNIIAGAIQPEECDNEDNNCNGCTDEGFNHFCMQSMTCCSWTNDAERETCLVDYEASITAGNPDGDLELLPCTTPAQSLDPEQWLCYDPTEVCDGIDNNCDGQIDEGMLKCGSPLHCPEPEVCDGEDNDCDGLIDEDGVCGTCIPQPETCNGCDDDCDGIVDNGTFPSLGCGLPSPANCVGTRTCLPPQSVAQPGMCISGAGYGDCSNSPQAETCDGIDNNCDGSIDNGIAQSGTDCVPSSHAGGLTYGGTSQCTYGQWVCGGSSGFECQGGTGPSIEICDGIDNDCNGIVDDNVAGAGIQCGSNTPPCSPGVWTCTGGTMVCQGGVAPQPEVCDGIDNNCDGSIDNGPFADGPAPGATGCWDLPGICCSFGSLSWCPPAGATCADIGTLTNPCNEGTIVCSSGAWTCSGAISPETEVCDDRDNDCDGLTDEDNSGNILENECYTPGFGADSGCSAANNCTGECRSGVSTCGGANPGEWTGCIGEVNPVNEVCDGLDNDCDGQTDELSDMPWIGQPCSGACNGVWQCNSGLQECVGGTVSEGRCNGLDDDCDGIIDELDELQQDPMYNTPCGNDEGACEEGLNQCIGGAWVCIGATEPSPEVCDGLDNNCDGIVDEEADCPSVSGVDYWCIEGSCRPECDPGVEFSCPGGMECREIEINSVTEYVCMPRQGEECGGTVCPQGWNCINEVCVDPCAEVECENWEECRNGTCLDTSCSGIGESCGDGRFCINHECVLDPCWQLNCGADGGYCTRNCTEEGCTGECNPLVLCEPGFYEDPEGNCIQDLCFGVSCNFNQICSQETGICEDNLCYGLNCGSQVCFAGNCIDDPCDNLMCPAGVECVVYNDPANSEPYAICKPDSSNWIPGDGGGDITGRGGNVFGCSSSGNNSGKSPALFILLGMLGVLSLRSRFSKGGRA